ncbi:MAG: TolC family protein [Candidatus Riflebacteria bacterium]|nr:TolC family protein [Candidatus Riflebacteria bacterium]
MNVRLSLVVFCLVFGLGVNVLQAQSQFLTGLAASETVDANAPLTIFAGMVVSGNRNLLATMHDREGSMFARHKALEAFSPRFYYSADNAKSTNSSYNSLTGLEEDYSTRQHGYGAGVSQRTPLGQISYDFSSSKTEYTSTQTSYFQSLYLGVQSGLLRNDAKVDSLTRRIAHADYEMSKAQADSVLLDILYGSFQGLFNRMIAARNHVIKVQNLSFYASLVEEAEVKLKNGIGSELDLKQASMRMQQAETGNAETGLTVEETDRRLAAQLGNLAWDRQIASFALEPILDAIPEKLDAKIFEAEALASRPDYQMFLSQYKQHKATFERARQLSRPDLSARARWGRQGRGISQDSAAGMPDKSWDVSLIYSTSFGPEGEKLDFSMQRERLKAFEAKLAQKHDDIKLAVADTLARLEFHRRNLALLQQSMRLSAEVLEGQQLNFQLGKISLLDLTRYQQEYDNASLAVIQGEARMILEWLRLHYETGTLAHFLNVSQKKGIKAAIIPVTNAQEDVQEVSGDE